MRESNVAWAKEHALSARESHNSHAERFEAAVMTSSISSRFDVRMS
jgi:hypothetical protein